MADTFGARLKQLREAAGLTQAALAEKAGLHKLTIARFEQGLRDPGWHTVQALAAALGTDCKAFEGTVPVNDEQPPPPAPRGRPKKPAPGVPPGKPKGRGKGRKGGKG